MVISHFNMKQLILFFFIILLISCKTNQDSYNDINQAVVQDYAKLFSTSEKDSITNFILNYEKSSTNQICVMTIVSLPKNTNALYHATNLANDLGVGIADKDNGLLLLISIKDRQIAFATGYGTEKVLTDSICKRLIDSTLVPSFKKNNYFEGVTRVLDSLKVKWK